MKMTGLEISPCCFLWPFLTIPLSKHNYNLKHHENFHFNPPVLLGIGT